jgi:hypothetical protein
MQPCCGISSSFKLTVDQAVANMRQNGQLRALRRLYVRMSRLEASGMTPAQRKEARKEYKALFAQLQKL